MTENDTLRRNGSERLMLMPIAISAKDMIGVISRALSFLAVFVLVIVGGTYAHADEVAHQHPFVDGASSLALPEHTHINNAGSNVDESSDIHCGGLIYFPPLPQGVHFVLQINKPMILADQRSTGLSNGLDPPPPRLLSEVI